MSKKHQQEKQKPATPPQEKPAAEKAPDDHATQAKLHGELAKLAGEPLDPGAAQRLQAAHAEAQKGAGVEMMDEKGGLTPEAIGRVLDVVTPELMKIEPTLMSLAPQGSPAGDPSEQGDKPLEKALSDKAFEAGVWEGVAAAHGAQLEELLERLRAISREGEEPAAVLDRLMIAARAAEEVMGSEHPHVALVSVVQTDAKPERYTVRLLEKTPAGVLSGTTLCKNKVWSECRESLGRVVSTRLVPEQFRE